MFIPLANLETEILGQGCPSGQGNTKLTHSSSDRNHAVSEAVQRTIQNKHTGAEGIVSPLELLAGGEVLALSSYTLEVVSVVLEATLRRRD